MGKMSKISLRETIKNTLRVHLLENNGLIMGQCLTAVGWVGGTLPEMYEKNRITPTRAGQISIHRKIGKYLLTLYF